MVYPGTELCTTVSPLAHIESNSHLKQSLSHPFPRDYTHLLFKEADVSVLLKSYPAKILPNWV